MQTACYIKAVVSFAAHRYPIHQEPLVWKGKISRNLTISKEEINPAFQSMGLNINLGQIYRSFFKINQCIKFLSLDMSSV